MSSCCSARILKYLVFSSPVFGYNKGKMNWGKYRMSMSHHCIPPHPEDRRVPCRPGARVHEGAGSLGGMCSLEKVLFPRQKAITLKNEEKLFKMST